MDIRNTLKRLMEERGVSIFEISKDSRISFQTIQNILDGTTKTPQAKTIRRLAEFFRMTVRQMESLDAPEETETSERIGLIESRLVQLENQMAKARQDRDKNLGLFSELLIPYPPVVDPETRVRLESKYNINIGGSRLDEINKNAILRYLWVVEKFEEFRTILFARAEGTCKEPGR